VRRALVAAALTLAAAPAAAAPAQAPPVFIVDGADGGIPVRASGGVVVDWHSDPATCEPLGRCGLDGVVAWRVPRDGSLRVFGRGRDAAALLGLGEVLEDTGAAATARVRRGPNLCADASPVEALTFLERERGGFPVGLGREVLAAILGTRCAGPALEDVVDAVPSVRVPLARLRRGRTTIRVRGEGTFAAHGLRGTVTSTLALRLGRPRPDRRRSPSPFPRRRVRYVVNRFRVAEVRGEVALDVAGADDPRECAPLDSCGLAGVLRLVPRATAGSAELVAVAPARVSRRSLRAAVGLAPGRAPAGVLAFGAAHWAGPGVVATAVGRPDDAVPCRDAVALRGGLVLFEPAGARLEVSYHALGAPSRTRCPGPALPAALGTPLATGDVPLRALGARRVELPLTEPGRVVDDGWAAESRPSLTLVLERREVVEVVRREPGF
jgi:hypothetical protein